MRMSSQEVADVRRLLVAPLLALMLVLGVVGGAGAGEPESDWVSGALGDRQVWYSEATPTDATGEHYTDRTIQTYKGKVTIGNQTETVSLTADLTRTYPATFFDDGTGEVDLAGTSTWDLRKFGHGTCTGPVQATMTQNDFWQFPIVAQVSATCDSGANLQLGMEGVFPLNHPMTKVNYSHYVFDVSGTLTLSD